MATIAPIQLGGTNASTEAGARTNLGLYSKAEVDALINAVITSSSPQGRLTGVPGVSVPDSEIGGADKIYYTPHIGTLAPRWNGSIWQHSTIGNGLSLTLDADSGHTNYHASGDVFDLFIITESGTEKLATGPRWINGATELGSSIKRGKGTGSTELELFNGVIVNKNSIIARFGPNSGDVITIPARQATAVGSMSPIANGMAADSEVARLLYNFYNQVDRPLFRQEQAVTWDYSLATGQIANNNSANKLKMLLGLPGARVEASLQAYCICTSATAPGLPIMIRIGDGGITALERSNVGWETVTTSGRTLIASFRGVLMGLKELWWVEAAMNPSGHTYTWYGAGANPNGYSGFTANIRA